MKEEISILYGATTNMSSTLDIPNSCPHCGGIMSPKVFKGYSTDFTHDINKHIGILAKCTIDECGRYYSVEYIYQNNKWNFKKSNYRPRINIELPVNIEKISPSFVDIYSQATIAESEKLDQIAGVGYRKAAEFLIKDYAISKNPTSEEDIKKQMLGKVIKEYFDDFPKIQQLATAIAWIGNDETHYVRRHDDRDISDLKRFIRASAQFIAADYDADEALDFTSNS